MGDRAFIFTMDAILALIPVFIILGGMAQLTDAQSLYTQSYILGSERVVQDVLESMRIHGDFDVLGPASINETIREILPPDYDFEYNVTYQGNLIVSVSSGSPPDDADIIAGKRTAMVNFLKILDAAYSITHGGDPGSEEYCSCTGNQHVWALNFSYAPNDYDYWLLGERGAGDSGIPTFWRITDTEIPTSDCNSGEKLCSLNVGDGQQMFSGTDTIGRAHLTEGSVWNTATMTANKPYYVYVRVVGNPSDYMDFFVIRTLPGEAESEVTSTNAKRYKNADVTLRIWRD